MLKSLIFAPCKERNVRVEPWVIATRFSFPGEGEGNFLNPGACIPRAHKPVTVTQERVSHARTKIWNRPARVAIIHSPHRSVRCTRQLSVWLEFSLTCTFDPEFKILFPFLLGPNCCFSISLTLLILLGLSMLYI
jgi:hypothetical protein